MKKQFSILLISSSIDNPEVRERYRNAGVLLAPPLGLYRLKCYIENLNLAKIDIFDPNLYRDNLKKMLYQHFKHNNNYRIIGFSPTHVNLGYDLKLIWEVYNYYQNKGLRQPLYITGGNEATNNYQALFEFFNPLGISVLGPGERPLELIIKRMKSNIFYKKFNFLDIPGTVVKDSLNNKLVRKDAIPEDVQTFRKMAFDHDPTHLIPYHLYWNCVGQLYSQDNLASRGATLKCIRLYTANHCQMQCNFCTSKAFHKNSCGGLDVPVARLTPKQMVTLIKKCWSYHKPDAFYFNDDDFIGDNKSGRKRAIEFCKTMDEERILGNDWANVVLYCQTQALWLTKMINGNLSSDLELCMWLKKAGFKIICMGVENLSPRLLLSKSIQKSYTPRHATIAIQGLKQVGIIPLINIILFPPEVTEEDLIVNIKECGRLIADGVIISMQEFVEVFPGSRLYQDIITGERRVKTVFDDVKIKNNGMKVKSNERVLPEDENIRRIINELYKTLSHLNEYLQKKPWFSFEVTPKHLNALTMLMATSQLLGRQQDFTFLEGIARHICMQSK